MFLKKPQLAGLLSRMRHLSTSMHHTSVGPNNYHAGSNAPNMNNSRGRFPVVRGRWRAPITPSISPTCHHNPPVVQLVTRHVSPHTGFVNVLHSGVRGGGARPLPSCPQRSIDASSSLHLSPYECTSTLLPQTQMDTRTHTQSSATRQPAKEHDDTVSHTESASVEHARRHDEDANSPYEGLPMDSSDTHNSHTLNDRTTLVARTSATQAGTDTHPAEEDVQARDRLLAMRSGALLLPMTMAPQVASSPMQPIPASHTPQPAAVSSSSFAASSLPRMMHPNHRRVSLQRGRRTRRCGEEVVESSAPPHTEGTPAGHALVHDVSAKAPITPNDERLSTLLAPDSVAPHEHTSSMCSTSTRSLLPSLPMNNTLRDTRRRTPYATRARRRLGGAPACLPHRTPRPSAPVSMSATSASAAAVAAATCTRLHTRFAPAPPTRLAVVRDGRVRAERTACAGLLSWSSRCATMETTATTTAASYVHVRRRSRCTEPPLCMPVTENDVVSVRGDVAKEGSLSGSVTASQPRLRLMARTRNDAHEDTLDAVWCTTAQAQAQAQAQSEQQERRERVGCGALDDAGRNGEGVEEEHAVAEAVMRDCVASASVEERSYADGRGVNTLFTTMLSELVHDKPSDAHDWMLHWFRARLKRAADEA